MPRRPPWHTWRKSFCKVIGSILGPELVLPARQAFIRQPTYGAAPRQRSISSIRANFAEADERQDSFRKEIRTRVRELEESGIEAYPQYAKDDTRFKSLYKFIREYDHLEAGEVGGKGSMVEVHVAGRIHSIRIAGSRLIFIDIVEGGNQKLQVVLSYSSLAENGLSLAAFVNHRRLMRRGDIIAVTGHPLRTKSGELSIRAQQLPIILSPCLQLLPDIGHGSSTAQTGEVHTLGRHVEMQLDRGLVQTLIRRSEIIRLMRTFFEERLFVEVETPILAGTAGGASARPFQTTAAEFPDRNLSLRISPELWLKRLIIGGMEKIFEIGPSFRNEGLDKTHNPEFTTCEFYSTYTTLPELLSTTESLLDFISSKLRDTVRDPISDRWLAGARPALEQPQVFYKGPYARIDFIPALNAALQLELPNLVSVSARSDLLAIFEKKELCLPSNPTVPRLLDKLSSTYLELECQGPTWIINIPECLSPLSKSFVHPTAPNEQAVAARAELFINGREFVNCYEEENDPFEQRRKFEMQQVYARGSEGHPYDDEVMSVDEDYLGALEWGLPPTGGWGCGIDRLVMLMCGKERIADVLSFGSLRAVTRGAKKMAKSGQIEEEKTDIHD